MWIQASLICKHNMIDSNSFITRIDVPIHVDAASGGFVAPFVFPRVHKRNPPHPVRSSKHLIQLYYNINVAGMGL